MKKSLVVVFLLLFCAPLTFATLVTNMNQSALYFRTLSRNASTDVDAVFYNPAGLMQLQNGFHVYLSNQTIFQTKTVTNNFPLLNNAVYEGKVNVPFFPDFYAVYKMERLALSFGFGPNAGGGTADYAKGLPSFEIPISMLPALLSSYGVPTNNYSADIAFKGSSVFWGFQANVSAALMDWLDAAAGMRVILAHNTYEGSIQNIMIDPYGTMISAPAFFNAIHMPSLAAATADKAVNAAQDGTGFTPILSLNLRPMDGLNIGIKYEFITKLTLTNKTTQDDVAMFPDGAKTHNDIPAIFSVGAQYEVIPGLKAMLSFNYFFDKNADWDGREDFVDSNSWDLGAGVEYALSEGFAVSAGILRTSFTLLPAYNSDLSHEMSATSLGGGVRVGLMKNLDVDLGLLVSFYDKSSKEINYGFFLGTEKYERKNFGFAIGFNYHI